MANNNIIVLTATQCKLNLSELACVSTSAGITTINTEIDGDDVKIVVDSDVIKVDLNPNAENNLYAQEEQETMMVQYDLNIRLLYLLDIIERIGDPDWTADRFLHWVASRQIERDDGDILNQILQRIEGQPEYMRMRMLQMLLEDIND